MPSCFCRTLFLSSAIFFSCNQNHSSNSSLFEERIVNEAIELRNGRIIELRDIYPALTDSIPEASNDTAILAAILKKKGFKTVNSGWGNFLHGPGMITFSLKKDDCECEVGKYYYRQTEAGLFLVTESIYCK